MTDIKAENETGMKIESNPETGAIANANVEGQQEQIISDPRKSVMDIIYANRAKAFEKELEQAAAQSFGATNETIKDDQPEENDRKEEPEQLTKSEENVSNEETTNENVAEQKPTKRTVVVDGRPIEFTEEEYAKLAEKGLYANQQPQQNQVQQAPQPDTQLKKAEEPQKDQQTDALRDIARRITYGNEEESTKALADLINTAVAKAGQNQTNPNQIAQVATQQALAQIQFQKNLDTIASEYADIFDSRAKTLVAADHVNSLRHKYNMLGTPKNDLDLYREAAMKTREEFGTKSETTKQGEQNKIAVQTADLGSKVERKRAAPKTPTAATKVVAMEPTNRAPTGSDIVAAMRKSRGQA